jgi:hypothetical protein
MRPYANPVAIILLAVFLLYSCSIQNNGELTIVEALTMSGKNRSELEKVFNHYKHDTLKLKAAEYLIQNMPYHFSIDNYLLSPKGEKFRPDISIFNTSEKLALCYDSVYMKGYHLVANKRKDIETLDSSYLVKNIDLAFSLRSKDWVKNIPFEDFCRYILPYRSQNEPASNLREVLMKRYLPLLDSAKVNNPLDAARIINKQLSKELHFVELGNQLYPTIDETYHSGLGECEALCNYATFVMRSVGIPTAITRTVWTKTDLGHYWCTIMCNDSTYDFDPGGDSFDTFKHNLAVKPFLKPAKVYRLRFDPEPLPFSDMEDDGYVTTLKNPLFVDVTNKMESPTISFQIETDGKTSKSKSLVYLCTFNNYKWIPIAIGSRNNKWCHFYNVVGNNIFMVAEASGNSDLHYISAPFLVDEKGHINKFIPNKTHKEKYTFHKHIGSNNVTYTLFYWNNRKNVFSEIKSDSTRDSLQFYSQIPDNALLWFVCPLRTFRQRVGYIKQGRFLRTCDF